MQILEAQLKQSAMHQELAIKEAVNKAEKQRDHIAAELQQMREQQATEQRLAETKFAKEMQAMTLQKENEVRDLQAQLNAGAMQRQLAVNEAVSSVEKQRDALQSVLKEAELKHQLESKSLKERYGPSSVIGIRPLNVCDMKARLSTKMVGETLEQHCETEFTGSRSCLPEGLFRKGQRRAQPARVITSFATKTSQQ